MDSPNKFQFWTETGSIPGFQGLFPVSRLALQTLDLFPEAPLGLVVFLLAPLEPILEVLDGLFLLRDEHLPSVHVTPQAFINLSKNEKG